jgi:hypothetical protein
MYRSVKLTPIYAPCLREKKKATLFVFTSSLNLLKILGMVRFIVVLLLFANIAWAQKPSKNDKYVLNSLKQHIGFLSSDILKGRRAGDSGEVLAADYIANQFTSYGLIPKGADGGFLQPFSIFDGKDISQSTYFKVNGQSLIPLIDYFPISNSVSSNAISADISPELNETGQPWIIDLAEPLEQQKSNPHFDPSNVVIELLNNAHAKGAPAVIFYNSNPDGDQLKFDSKDQSTPTIIPAVYLTTKAKEDYLADPYSSYRIDFSISFSPRIRMARNVVGYIDNGAALTIVLGAHFDHLGYGEDGNSMIRGGGAAIHNGADDNASGTSAIIELASQLSRSKSKPYNYLFIAFSAEELGLNGSKFFVDNPTIPLNTINYMINLDMVGRMNDSTKSITVGGYGTSPSWKSMIESVKQKPFSIRFDSSGTGPSDHTSFYRKDIPVLFFFTGLHTDYHKPSDDADKINYLGTVQIVNFIRELILSNPSTPKLAFTKTREQQTSTSARFTVSMGIMPDYSFSGNGVRVDGVSDNRPAKRAGVLAGDVIKQLGVHSTSSVEGYMQALSKFKKGEQTTVVIARGDKEFTLEIIF